MFHAAVPALLTVFQDSPLSPKRQAQIQDVVTRLARFHPTKVLVEADMVNPVYADRYRQYLAGTYAHPQRDSAGRSGRRHDGARA